MRKRHTGSDTLSCSFFSNTRTCRLVPQSCISSFLGESQSTSRLLVWCIVIINRSDLMLPSFFLSSMSSITITYQLYQPLKECPGIGYHANPTTCSFVTPIESNMTNMTTNLTFGESQRSSECRPEWRSAVPWRRRCAGDPTRGLKNHDEERRSCAFLIFSTFCLKES